jgi:signal transduction histidine kinase
MLERVFYNLLDNSVRRGHGVRNVRVSSEDLSDDLRIVYEDDGVGIEAGDRERLFERGFGKNTGLGLYLCGEILDLTGASIIEAGKPGGGARFEIRFPSRHWKDT